MAGVTQMSRRNSTLDPYHASSGLGLVSSPVQRWDGIARTSIEWNALRRDEELWFDGGECYVYLYRPGQSQRGPSFRLPYELIVKAECNDLLDNHLIATWNSSPYSPSCPGGDCYLYLHAPSDLAREEAFKYHIDTRNFFAWIVGAPIVGPDPVSALSRLKTRLDAWRDKPADNLGALIAYIRDQGYCDDTKPIESAFIRKRPTLPTPKGRRDSFLGRLKLQPSGYGKRMAEMTTGASSKPPTSFSFPSLRSDVSSRRYSEIIIPEYGNGLHGRRTSTDSTRSDDWDAPSLTHSSDESKTSLLSSTESFGTPPTSSHTPDAFGSDANTGESIKEHMIYELPDNVQISRRSLSEEPEVPS